MKSLWTFLNKTSNNPRWLIVFGIGLVLMIAWIPILLSASDRMTGFAVELRHLDTAWYDGSYEAWMLFDHWSIEMEKRDAFLTTLAATCILPILGLTCCHLSFRYLYGYQYDSDKGAWHKKKW